ncbi:MAG: GtrA family protein [Candidatus Pacebacteria bacterium]|jgi:putative flippase GtrA|nr:GtrA family protein [Candidatus Paceibacterota bacterium]
MNFKQRITDTLKIISKDFYVYLIIGMCTFLIDYFLYLFFLDLNTGMNIAKASSSLIAVVLNYIFNSRFNFGGKNTMKSGDLSIYVLIYCFLILIHVIMNRELYLILQEEHISVLLAMSVSVFINYACVKRFFSYTKNKNYVI